MISTFFPEYLKESWGREYKEWDFGFVSYEINYKNRNLHIHDVYIVKAERGNGRYAEILDFLYDEALENELKYMTGCIDERLPTYKESVIAQTKNGAKFLGKEGTIITMGKEL